jgi:hypothetical protein
MMNESKPKLDLSHTVTYQIKIQGQLDEYWSNWFDGLTMVYDEYDNTIVTVQVADQSALYGLLKKVRDLGLPLISVNVVTPDIASRRGGSDSAADKTE